MSNSGNELNDDFYVEDTDIMVTPSPKAKKRKQVSICVHNIIIDHYILMF